MPPFYLHVWVNVGDSGPDQHSFRTSLHTHLAISQHHEFQLLFSLPCLKHQLHLIVKDSLQLTNQLLAGCARKYSYFGAVAKLAHTWRSHGEKIARAWAVLFSKPWEYRAASAVPPLAVAGRWGSIDGVVACV